MIPGSGTDRGHLSGRLLGHAQMVGAAAAGVSAYGPPLLLAAPVALLVPWGVCVVGSSILRRSMSQRDEYGRYRLRSSLEIGYTNDNRVTEPVKDNEDTPVWDKERDGTRQDIDNGLQRGDMLTWDIGTETLWDSHTDKKWLQVSPSSVSDNQRIISQAIVTFQKRDGVVWLISYGNGLSDLLLRLQLQ